MCVIIENVILVKHIYIIIEESVIPSENIFEEEFFVKHRNENGQQ